MRRGAIEGHLGYTKCLNSINAVQCSTAVSRVKVLRGSLAVVVSMGQRDSEEDVVEG